MDFWNISCKTDSVTFAIVLLLQPAMLSLWQELLISKSKLKKSFEMITKLYGYRQKILRDGHGLNSRLFWFRRLFHNGRHQTTFLIGRQKLRRRPKQTAAIMKLGLLKFENNKFILEVW